MKKPTWSKVHFQVQDSPLIKWQFFNPITAFMDSRVQEVHELVPHSYLEHELTV